MICAQILPHLLSNDVTSIRSGRDSVACRSLFDDNPGRPPRLFRIGRIYECAQSGCVRIRFWSDAPPSGPRSRYREILQGAQVRYEAGRTAPSRGGLPRQLRSGLRLGPKARGPHIPHAAPRAVVCRYLRSSLRVTLALPEPRLSRYRRQLARLGIRRANRPGWVKRRKISPNHRSLVSYR